MSQLLQRRENGTEGALLSQDPNRAPSLCSRLRQGGAHVDSISHESLPLFNHLSCVEEGVQGARSSDGVLRVLHRVTRAALGQGP